MVSRDISIYIEINHIYVLYMKYIYYIYSRDSPCFYHQQKKTLKTTTLRRETVILWSPFSVLQKTCFPLDMWWYGCWFLKAAFSLSCSCLCFVMESAVLVFVVFYGMIILLYMQIRASSTPHNRDFFQEMVINTDTHKMASMQTAKAISHKWRMFIISFPLRLRNL